jgi:ethanolamine utilization protein EutA
MIESKYIKSVGFDIGTSTTHVVFSEILLKKDPKSRTNKFEIADRKLLFSSKIYQTPLQENGTSVDISKLENIFEEIYREAGISINNVDTGAVIITGETAKKENAEAVVSLMAENAGKFVAATAGPHYESIIAAKGSGAVDESKTNKIKVISIDIGGGTSNIAYIDNGNIISTACINIGGSLAVIEKRKDLKNNLYVIKKAEPAFITTYESVNKNSIHEGQLISQTQLMGIIDKLVDSLFESISNNKTVSKLTQKLLMTEPLQVDARQEEHLKLIISGGVAEYVYKNSQTDYGDIGFLLAKTILNKLPFYPQFKLFEPKEKIRATVIGAGQYTLEVSGSTTFVKAPDEIFPLRNYPVVIPKFSTRELTPEIVETAIKKALLRLDINPVSDYFILAFENPVSPVYERITKFVKGIEKALIFLSKQPTRPLIMVFDTDIGNSVGNILQRETALENPIVSLDEIFLNEGDFIDIGDPIIEKRVFPVVVKSLIFND